MMRQTGFLTGGTMKAHMRKMAIALLASSSALLAVTLYATQSMAQTVPASYSVPAGPLGAAISRFGDNANLQVLYPADLVRGKQTKGVRGNMSREEALSRLLAGTGLSYRFTSSDTVTLEPLPREGSAGIAPDGSTVLSTIVVNGQGENAWGPAQGFVAHLSATATKTDTPILETPQTINVVTARQIETLKPSKLAETLRYTPGVVTEFQPSTSYFDRIRIRGFYSNNNIYLDGTQLTPSGTLAVAQVDPFLLERVEVLKGPASVLYGQNGSGGLINMVSKRPLGNNDREIGFSVGTDKHLETTIDWNGVSADETFSYRIAGVGRRADLDSDYGETERYAIAPSFTWRPSEDTNWTVRAALQRDPEGNSSSYLPAVGTILPNINGQFPRGIYTCDPTFCDYDRKQYYVGSDFRHKLNEDLEFRQNLRFTYVDVNSTSFRLGALKADQKTVSRPALNQAATTRGIAADNSLKYDFDIGDTRNELIAGFDYRRFSSDNLSLSGTNSSLDLNLFDPVYGNYSLPTLARRTDNNVVLEQYGVYAQNQMSLGNWRLLTGLRQDWANTTNDNFLTDLTTETRDDALTGRAGLLYLFDNGLAPYVSYSTSFEPTSGTDYYGETFKPTEGKQWEIGLKYEPQWFNGVSTASLYDLKRTNVTTADNEHTCAAAPNLPDCGNFSVQTGEVRVRGLELESKISLTEKVNASFGYTYMDAEVTSSNDGYEGNRTTNTPNHMASAWLDYTFREGVLDGLTLGGGVRYVGSMYADDDNLKPIPAYTLGDAMLAYELGRLSPNLDGSKLAVSVTNLADKKAVGGCTSASYCDYVDGRSIIGSLKIKF
ncbi:TonB-dependent siderophore receptor [Halomonas sp. 3D7M]|uniref:TonB-dependent siderophore receptor n=1 Tax=Halomonas sp. 3D7M TaxID=2742617 RepID=UPI0018672DF0|nr:TonB-dependent siderophore receptor [Halomonas sp. 3D7M]